MEPSPDAPTDERSGLGRRDVLRRGAILGGTLVWTVPAVQTIAGPAFAAGSPCVGKLTFTDNAGNCQQITFVSSDACCACIAQQQAFFQGPPFNFPPGPAAIFAAAACGAQGTCAIDNAGPC